MAAHEKRVKIFRKLPWRSLIVDLNPNLEMLYGRFLSSRFGQRPLFRLETKPIIVSGSSSSTSHSPAALFTRTRPQAVHLRSQCEDDIVPGAIESAQYDVM